MIDAVTYTSYTIPLKSGSLVNDPKGIQSAIISGGTLICENVDISNRYTAYFVGAMQILAGSATLTDCDFIHNYGTTYGGAIYVYNAEELIVTNSSFSGNTVTSDVVTLCRTAAVELAIVTQPVDTLASLNEGMAVSLEAVGEEVKYQWYWRNEGDEEFQKSSCRTNTCYTTMTKARNGRKIYCVITDALGNQVVSDVVTLTMG